MPLSEDKDHENLYSKNKMIFQEFRQNLFESPLSFEHFTKRHEFFHKL